MKIALVIIFLTLFVELVYIVGVDTPKRNREAAEHQKKYGTDAPVICIKNVVYYYWGIGGCAAAFDANSKVILCSQIK